MSQKSGLNRRTFLRSAGLTAVVGAVGTRTSLAGGIADAAAEPANGKYDFDTPYNRIGTNCTKWDSPLRSLQMDHIVAGMGIADIDFPCAPAITKALQDRLTHEIWGYASAGPEFAEGIIAWNKKRYGVDINPDQLAITTGVHPGLIAALRSISPPGSKVLLTTPTYNGFYGDLRASNTLPEESLMKYSNGKYSIDFEDLERRMTAETKSLILCNPQNPTGNCWSLEDLTTLGAMCLKHNVVVLADEIHCDYVTKGQKYVPFSSIPNQAIVNNSLTFKAASKSFGLAAMKCAWFFSSNRDLFNAARAQNRADLTDLGRIANQAAYASGEAWLNQCVDYIDGNHDFVQSYITKNMPLVKIGAKPQGTYLTWLDVSPLMEKIGAKEAAAEASKAPGPGGAAPRPVTPETIVERWLAKNAFVALNAGQSYGKGGENHMRMNIGLSRKTLEAALVSMSSAMQKL